MMYYVVKALDGNLHNVILGIIHDAEERDPIRLYLASQIQRGDLDFRLGRVETFRDLIEKRRHLRLIQLASHHLNSPYHHAPLRSEEPCSLGRHAAQSARLSWQYRACH